MINLQIVLGRIVVIPGPCVSTADTVLSKPAGNRTQPTLVKIETTWAQAVGAAETETHGNQRLLTQ